MNIISIDKSFLQNLCCVKCKGFLTVPIIACTDGPICGNCTPDDKSIPLPILDCLIRNARFPCKYQKSGCIEDLEYEFVGEHQSKCEYQNASCVVEDCEWEGLLIELSVHIIYVHTQSILRSPEIILDKAKDTNKIFFHFEKDVLFIIRCNYDYAIGILNYNVTYISAFINTATYSILNGIQEVAKGDIYPHQPTISTTSATKLKVEKKVNTLKMNVMFNNYAHYSIEVTNDLLCQVCKELLASSVIMYNCQPVDVMCDPCSQLSKFNSSRSIDEKYSSCKWKGCHFIFKTNKLYLHELTCPFYVYTCSIEKCDTFGNSQKISTHLHTDHNYQNSNINTYIKLRWGFSSKIFYKKYNTFVLICCKREVNENFQVQLKSLGPCNNVGAYFSLGHDHCKIKSKTFLIKRDCTIGGDILPECFRRPDPIYVDIDLIKCI